MLTRHTFIFLSTAIATFGVIFAWKKLNESITLDCGNGVKLELVKIPIGSFMMGSDDNDGMFINDGNAKEQPIHQVRVPSFYMGSWYL